MSGLAQLADYVRKSRSADLPAHQRAHLRRHIADAGVALVAGAHSPEGASLLSLSDGDDWTEAAATAAGVIRSTEVDDIHLGSCTTPTSVAMPAALLIGAQPSPEAAEDAIRIGVELMVRLGLAIHGPEVLYKGVWPTCFSTPLGVAAVAARLWGLGEEATVNALSMALMVSSGRTGRFNGTPTGRWVLLRCAVQNGLRAAHAARKGYKGDSSLLDGEWLKNAQGLDADLSLLTSGFDSSLSLPGLGAKPFSTARQALSATQALIALLNEGLAVERIKSIRVFVPPAYQRMISQPIDRNSRSSGYVSAPFQMALAALRPEGLWDLDRSRVMQDDALYAFAARISVDADPELQKAYPARWQARIEVETEAGVMTRTIENAHGDAANPLQAEDMEKKAVALLSPALGEAQARAAWVTGAQAFDSAASLAAFTQMLQAQLSAKR